MEQIEAHKLPPQPAKKSDSRYEDFINKTGSSGVWELDALPPKTLRKTIRRSIEDNIEPEPWNKCIKEEKEATEELNKAIDLLRETIQDTFPEIDLGGENY